MELDACNEKAMGMNTFLLGLWDYSLSSQLSMRLNCEHVLCWLLVLDVGCVRKPSVGSYVGISTASTESAANLFIIFLRVSAARKIPTHHVPRDKSSQAIAASGLLQRYISYG